jgi:hypothetical protein
MSHTWQEPWAALSESERAAFRRQLACELVPAHPLFGRELIPVGKHSATDDVLVELTNTQLAVVHLTWGGAGDARYPRTTFFHDWAHFTANRMGPDALAYR